VPKIIEVYRRGRFVYSGSAKEIAEEFGVHPSIIRKAVKKGKWRSEYDVKLKEITGIVVKEVEEDEAKI
jgi:uncharacterized protein YjcR